MKWSWRIGQIGGIGLYIHYTFVLLLGWIFLARYLVDYNLRDALEALVFILLMFGIVVLHELGHAFAAHHYGIATRDITLLPIGGVARLERMPEDPRQELVVALAGPMVNVVIAILMLLLLGLTQSIDALKNSDMLNVPIVPFLFVFNVWLVIFNLLPAFPMDGGRVLRALLAIRGDYVQATQTAASIGQFMALVFGFLGLLLGYPLWIFVALFVYMGAAQEASMTQVRYALAGIPVSRAMIREFHTLAPEEPLESATQHVVNGFQHDFPVVEGGKVVGILTSRDLLRSLAKEGERGRVGDAMQREFQTVDPADMLEQAMNRLQEKDCRSMPVVRNGELVGLVTMDNLGEFLMIRSALREAHKAVS